MYCFSGTPKFFSISSVPFCFLSGAERATNGVLPETISARSDGANDTGAVLSLKAASHICILETSATLLP